MNNIQQLYYKNLKDFTEISDFVDSHLVFTVVETGCVDLTIPEIGLRQVNEKSWFIVADKGVASTLRLSEDCTGISITLPLAELTDLQKVSKENNSSLACLSCNKRTAPFFQKGTVSSRITELSRSISDNAELSWASHFLRISRCYELVSRILQQPEISRPAACRRFITTNDRAPIEKVAAYLRANLAEDHSLNDLCKYCYINEFKLKKGFKEHYGTTVFGYLRQKRMEKAKEYFEEGATSVLEVANEVGYSNASHFARAFRDEFGMNPSETIAA